MTTPTRTTVVIPAYRNVDVGACLEALLASWTAACPFDVHVVLNDATARVEEIVAAFGDAVTTTRLDANHGVSGGFNQGFAATATEFVVQLQDDVLVQPGWLSPLVECADATPDAGAVASLTLDADGRVSDPGWLVTADGRTTPGLPGGNRDPAAYVGARPIDYHGSTGMLFRRTAWQSVGGFDYGFYPAYYGDVDVCWRLRRRGWRILLEPASRVRHAGHASTTSSYRVYLVERNRARFLALHEDTLHRCDAEVGDQVAIDRSIAAFAKTADSPAPAAPTPQEIRQLEERLAVDTDAFLRLERDVRRDYGEWVEQRRDEIEHAWRTTQEELDRERADRAECTRRLGELEAGLRDARAHAAELERAINRVARSRSWRFTSPLRRIGALVRGADRRWRRGPGAPDAT